MSINLLCYAKSLKDEGPYVHTYTPTNLRRDCNCFTRHLVYEKGAEVNTRMQQTTLLVRTQQARILVNRAGESIGSSHAIDW